MKKYSIAYVWYPEENRAATWQVLDVNATSPQSAIESATAILTKMDEELGGLRLAKQIGKSGDFDRLIGRKYPA